MYFYSQNTAERAGPIDRQAVSASNRRQYHSVAWVQMRTAAQHRVQARAASAHSTQQSIARRKAEWQCWRETIQETQKFLFRKTFREHAQASSAGLGHNFVVRESFYAVCTALPALGYALGYAPGAPVAPKPETSIAIYLSVYIQLQVFIFRQSERKDTRTAYLCLLRAPMILVRRISSLV